MVRLYHDHVLVKEPGTRQRTPWHQDLPYYNVDGRLNASMWFPVDPVTRAATLEFVAGSHLGPWYMPRSFLDGQARWFPDGLLAELPDIDADPQRSGVIGWELEPGDAVFFHMLTLHAAGGVDGPGRRRALSVRFLGDDMVHAPRSWPTSPPFPGLEQELASGALLDHPLFPVLWPVAAPTPVARPEPRSARRVRPPRPRRSGGRDAVQGSPRRSGNPARSMPRRQLALPRVWATKFHHMKIGDRNGTPPTQRTAARASMTSSSGPGSGSRAGPAR